MSRLTKRNNKGYAGIKGYHGLLTSYCYECTEELEDGVYLLEDALNKLAEYEDLEEQGLLLRLPCKVGDTVWYIPSYNGKPLGFINKDKVQMIGFTSRGIHFKLREHHEHNKMYMLGKSVFLTREEAEGDGRMKILVDEMPRKAEDDCK